MSHHPTFVSPPNLCLTNLLLLVHIAGQKIYIVQTCLVLSVAAHICCMFQEFVTKKRELLAAQATIESLREQNKNKDRLIAVREVCWCVFVHVCEFGFYAPFI